MRKTYFVSDLHLGHASIVRYSNRHWCLQDHPETSQQIKDAFGNDEKIAKIEVPKAAVPVMEDFIFDKINSKVSHIDDLWVLGDIGFANNANQFGRRVREWRKRINAGRVFLAWGNHDGSVPSHGLSEEPKHGDSKPQDREDYRKAIMDVFDGYYECCMVYCEGGIKVFVSHYPHVSWPDSHKKGLPGQSKPHKTISIHTYGHVHGSYTIGHENFVIDPVRREIHPWAAVDVGVDASMDWPWSAEEIYEKVKPQVMRITNGF